MLSYLVRRMFKSARPVDRRSVPQLQRLECRLTPVNVPNVMVNDPTIDSGPQGQSETSTIVYANAKGENIVLSAFNDFAVSGHRTGYAVSVNGGKFSDKGSLPTLPGKGDGGDPFVARDTNFDPNGRIYFATLANGNLNGVENIAIFRSDDDGASWKLPVEGQPNPISGAAGNDREWITVDNFPNDYPPNLPVTGQGNVYVAAFADQGTGGIWFSRSTNGGDSFSTSIRLSEATSAFCQGATIAVGKAHTVHVAWLDQES